MIYFLEHKRLFYEKSDYPIFDFGTGCKIAFAQPTLTDANNNLTAGESYQQLAVSNPPAGVHEGSDWGQCELGFFHSSLPAQCTQLISSRTRTRINPNANILYTQSGSSVYFGTTAGNFTFYGVSSSAMDVKYTDGEDQLRFPISFGDNYTDTKAGSITGQGINAQVSGTIAVAADAYGSLTTPEGTYNNVLRIRIVRHDTSIMNGVQTNSTDSIYYWYEPNTSFPVMTFQKNYSGGSFIQSAFTYLSENSISLTEQEDLSFSLYPNPAVEQVRLEGLPEGDFSLRLMSLSGRVLHRYSNKYALSVAGLPAGIYLIEVSTSNGKVVRSLVKE
ncbi:MAG: T9SS type A sorting domain-containing protein [Owenweeksia sp.]|nr:T9SS type A sorting domain-containing protein [Owenweeksia sp.]